jgi:type IV pilus assembly protein PilM
MFKFFKSNKRLGIDIGTAAIKAVELDHEGGRFTLSNYGLFELKGIKTESSSTAVVGQSILKLPDEEITWGLKELLSTAGIKTKDTVASIPSFSTFSTVIEMPYLSDQDLAKALPFEAKKYIPIPLDEVILDWSIVGSKQENSRIPIAEIFLAAVPKAETFRYKMIAEGAGLNLLAIELENSALIRALLGNDQSPIGLVNIGGRSTSIVVVDKGYERIGHSYEIGGFEITKSIARSLNISLEKAEDLKKRLGMKDIDENIINEAMLSLVDMMVFETKKTITNYEASKNKQVSKILLMGGLTNMPNFVEYFKQKLGRDIYIGNAFARVIYPEELNPIIKELASSFSVATGLAMREK